MVWFMKMRASKQLYLERYDPNARNGRGSMFLTSRLDRAQRFASVADVESMAGVIASTSLKSRENRPLTDS